MMIICFLGLLVFFCGLLLSQSELESFRLWLKAHFIHPKKIKSSYQNLFFDLSRNQILDEKLILNFKALPSFSFYKEMIGTYLSLTHSMGISPSLWALSLRKSFTHQFKFMISYRKKLQEIFFQTFVIYFLTYILALFISILLPEVELNLLPIFIWQIFGLIILIFTFIYLKNKKFSGLKECQYSLISFNTLLRIGISQQKIIELSGVDKLEVNSSFREINEWLLQIVKKWSKVGGKVMGEVETLQDEAWWQFEQRMEEFNQTLAILRLMILFIFGLPSYFSLFIGINQNLF